MDKHSERLVPWAIFSATLLLYLFFPTRNFYYDGIDFAHTIETAIRLSASLIHPSHLVYNLVGYIIYRSVRGVGIDTRAVEVLRITNSFLSIASAYVLFRILRASLQSLYLCSALTLLFLFSATWWRFSTDANAYIPSILFMLVSFYLIIPAQKGRPLLVALVFSLSMCFHQLAVVFYPVLALGLFMQLASSNKRDRVLNVFYFSGAAFVITFAAYWYCFYLATGTFNFARFVRWITYYSPDGSFSFNGWSNLGYTLRGHSRLFFGGRFNLIRELINPLILVLMIALGVIAFGLGFQLVRNFIAVCACMDTIEFNKQRSETAVCSINATANCYKRPDFKRMRAALRDLWGQPMVRLCAVWVAVYLIFLFVWMPQNTFYRMFYLPAIIILAGFALNWRETTARHGARRYRLALFVAALGIANFLFVIYPFAHIQKYPPLSFALEMNRVWPRGTVIYYAMPSSDNSLFRYFNPSTTWKQSDMNDLEVLESELRDLYSKGGAAWLDASAIDQLLSTAEGTEWLSRHAREESRRKLID